VKNTSGHVGIVGGAGFLGRALVEHLSIHRPDLRLTIFDVRSPGQWLNDRNGVHFEYLDITRKESLRGRFDGVDVLFHKAGILGGPRSVRIETCEEYLSVNTVGVYNVLEEATSSGVGKIIFDSTEQVFGPHADADRQREDDPAWPINYYGVSKIVAEEICRVFSRETSIVIFRYPRVRMASSQDIISAFVAQALEGRPIVLRGSGRKSFDFVDVWDVCRASELVLSADSACGVLHISSGEAVSLVDLVRLIEDVTGQEADVRFEPETARAFDADHYRLEIEQARTVLGYEPRVSVRDMVEGTYRWIRAQARVGAAQTESP
jgi:UDP-glucose 4-epimerase